MIARAVAALGLVLAGCDAMPAMACAVDGEVEGIDVDGDGRAEVRAVSMGGRELCREFDLNHDGKVDVVRVSAPLVGTLWRASDFDTDGRADLLELLPDAAVRHELIDRDFDGRPDLLRRRVGERTLAEREL